MELRCIYALAALPIIFLATGASKVYDREAFAYLPNANTAVLYFSALLFAVAQLYGNRVILLQFVNVALMNKIGAVLATAVALFLWVVFPIRKESIVALIFVILTGFTAFLLGAFDRVIAALDNLIFIFSVEPSTVSSMSYKELVQLTGTTDLSAFFRLIHWSNIWDLYSEQGFGTLLFGYGAGQTTHLSYAGLVPHNDYLRILAEYGPLSLIVFVCFLLHIWSALTIGANKVLFVVLCIYFFSENLLDNFTSMALFFAYAGRLTAASSQALMQSAPNREAIIRGLTARRT